MKIGLMAILTELFVLFPLCVQAESLKSVTVDNMTADAPQAPKFLLVMRYWGQVTKQHGDMMVFGQGWVYLYEVYQTPKDILARLRQPCGWTTESLVGCWRLTDDRKVKIECKVVKHEKKREVVTDEWTEDIWSIEEGR